MAYCTIQDIADLIGTDLLASLSSKKKGGVIKESYVNQIIDTKSEYIDTFLRGRYELPLTIEDVTLKTVCVDLVRLVLYSGTPGSIKSEDAALIQSSCEKTLDKLQKGNQILNVGGTSESRPGYMKSRCPKKTFTDDVFDYIL